MDKKFIELYSKKNSTELIKMLEPLIFTKLKEIPIDYKNDMYQENVLIILEYLNKNFKTTNLDEYLEKKNINYDMTKEKEVKKHEWNLGDG